MRVAFLLLSDIDKLEPYRFCGGSVNGRGLKREWRKAEGGGGGVRIRLTKEGQTILSFSLLIFIYIDEIADYDGSTVSGTW